MLGRGLLGADNPAGEAELTAVSPATDDWPLMYLRIPSLPRVYLAGLGMVALCALGLVTGLAGRGAWRGFNAQMFFLGVGLHAAGDAQPGRPSPCSSAPPGW